MKIYHTETQADYDALMVELERLGIQTLGKRYWEVYENQTVVIVHALCRHSESTRTDTAYGSLEWALQTYSTVPIQKYKAEADEKMKVTSDEIKIYHTETQEDYDALMIELEAEGITWPNGGSLTKDSTPNWNTLGNRTCIRVTGTIAFRALKYFYEKRYSSIPIIKYKAKADETMKFTKENVEIVIYHHLKETEDSILVDIVSDIYDMIETLDDTPEKVGVPKYIAEFYESKKHLILSEILKEFETNTEKEVADWYFSNTGRHDNTIANSQEIIAKMHVGEYSIQEQLYYARLPLKRPENEDTVKRSDVEDGEVVTMYSYLGKDVSNGTTFFYTVPPINRNVQFKFTKSELKELDPVYVHLAVKEEEGAW